MRVGPRACGVGREHKDRAASVRIGPTSMRSTEWGGRPAVAGDRVVSAAGAPGSADDPWVPSPGQGRVNQKQRTRRAIVDAAKRLASSGAEVTMPVVAREALVSEATAYRYFPDLASLLREADDGTWPSPEDALAPVAGRTDLVERVAFAAEFLFR